MPFKTNPSVIKNALLLIALLTVFQQSSLAAFVHPGGLHTREDLDRMKARVLAGESPWVDSWRQLERDPQAQADWKPAARANMGDSRQRADMDAHAAYLNTLRWYISGDTNYAECAVRICNAWSASVDQVPTGNDIPGLSGIPIFHFALAGELLRTYPGWQPDDFGSFTNMMVQHLYPVCHDFLVNHAGRCDSYFWANWDACNLGALIAMGVLCDNPNIFNEGVDYFKHGKGMGSISNAVPFLYSAGFGQWQESGRDQPHAQLGIGLFGSACQVAWNQGVDLFGFADNRLLAGAEYVAKCNLSYPASNIPYTFYNNCANARQHAISINGLGRLDERPVWELIYNHYAVQKGFAAPYSKAMAQLIRPEHGSKDHFGYGTLTYTLQASASPYPPNPVPAVPTGLKAEGGVSQVFLNWNKSPNDTAQGYVVRRSTSVTGPFREVATWNDHSTPQYADTSVSNGVVYYYVVAARNQAGVSGSSQVVKAQPVAAGQLPSGWSNTDIGDVGKAGPATYAEVGEHTFIAGNAGGRIGGKSDMCNFTHRTVAGDFEFSARILHADWSGRDKIGLMVRESVAPNAKSVTLTLGEIGNRQCRFRARTKAGASMTSQAGNDYTWLPAWFKIERVGDRFTGFQSVDGANWFKVGSSVVTMTDQCLVGLVVAGEKREVFNTTVFNHVVIDRD